ncbi:MAG: hypothetical protein JSW52_10275 [Candidatus Coatesbacteria bacterium]|nr:MAG: hypothetical protein JSW52_10275 [Candidatus Coatesbacteria bacterium]
MNVVKAVIAILLMTATLTAGYEVIFHEGFEGEQFPPAGWIGSGFEKYSPGYESEWCAYAYSFLSLHYWLQSCHIPIIGGELYEFRIVSECSNTGRGYHIAGIRFDDDTGYSLGLPHNPESYGWTMFAIQVYAPVDSETVIFHFACEAPGSSEYIEWCIDDVSVIHTAAGVTPASMGHVQAVYR